MVQPTHAAANDLTPLEAVTDLLAVAGQLRAKSVVIPGGKADILIAKVAKSAERSRRNRRRSFRGGLHGFQDYLD